MQARETFFLNTYSNDPVEKEKLMNLFPPSNLYSVLKLEANIIFIGELKIK